MLPGCIGTAGFAPSNGTIFLFVPIMSVINVYQFYFYAIFFLIKKQSVNISIGQSDRGVTGELILQLFIVQETVCSQISRFMDSSAMQSHTAFRK